MLLTTTTPIGSAIEVQVLCRESVAGVLTLFDPTTIAVSFVDPSGVETVLTYSGPEALDSQLTRAELGKYEAFLIPAVAGVWTVRCLYTHLIGGVEIDVKSNEVSVTVTADDHQF